MYHSLKLTTLKQELDEALRELRPTVLKAADFSHESAELLLAAIENILKAKQLLSSRAVSKGVASDDARRKAAFGEFGRSLDGRKC